MRKLFTPVSIPDQTRAYSSTSARSTSFTGRYFFVGMAVLFPILVALGFLPDYQGILKGQFKVHWFDHIHGAIMTSWILMFLAQTTLVARHNIRLHKRLGLYAVALGFVVWITMGITIVRALIGNNPPMADGQFDILFIQLYLMLLFGLFFAWGILVRKDTAAHKRLMLLATLVTMQAAIDRMPFLPGITEVLFPRFIYLDLLIIPLFIYDWLKLNEVHKVTLVGTLIICIAQIGIVTFWGSPGWHQFWFNRLSPFVEQVVEINLTDSESSLLIGDYGDKNWKMVVSREDRKLYLKLPDQPKWELGAISDTKLFVRTINWKMIFVKGPDGKVSKVINDQINIVWEKPRLK